VIDVINLKKSYGDLEVLKGITVSIKEGEKVAIIGPSGSGKSTFLRCLNCMEDPQADPQVRSWITAGYLACLSYC